MSAQLDELFFLIRQHAAFQELLKGPGEPPTVKPFKPSEDADAQFADFIFRSGRRQQHESWRQFLIGEQEKKT